MIALVLPNFMDPDGNETEVNTRYLYGVPER